MCFDFPVQLLSETFLILRTNERDTVKNVYSCPILMKLGFLDRFFQNSQISNFTKIRPLGAELFLADERTDMTKLIVSFRNFAKVPNKNQTLHG